MPPLLAGPSGRLDLAIGLRSLPNRGWHLMIFDPDGPVHRPFVVVVVPALDAMGDECVLDIYFRGLESVVCAIRPRALARTCGEAEQRKVGT